MLYISYDGALEPLGESQVVAYLRGLAASHRIVLVTYEKAADLADAEARERVDGALRAAGIRWVPLRYHKAPSVPATAWDMVIGAVVGRFLIWRHRIEIVHARSQVAGVIGWLLGLTSRARLVFDMRGLWADEKVDAGAWSAEGWLYRLAKRLERRLVRDADALVALTEAAVPHLRELAPERRDLPVTVIPTCVDLERFHPSPTVGPDLLVGCVGSVGPWGWMEMVAASFAVLRRLEPRAVLVVLNRGEHAPIRECLDRHGIPAAGIDLREVRFPQMPAEIRKLSVGLIFYRPGRSRVARAPTKLGEFMASGVPCLTSGGIGDVDRILEGEGVGMVLAADREDAHEFAWRTMMALAADPDVRRRCRRVAERYFSLQLATQRYDRIYAALGS